LLEFPQGHRAGMGSPVMSESEYKDELDTVTDEVYEAVCVHHIMEEINRLALDDEPVFRAMNEQPLFWRAHRATSQASLFLCLGRIFDTNDSATSIHRLVRNTMANVHIFSRAALGARKRVVGAEPAWLNTFLSVVWEPQSAADLRFLKDALKPRAKLFESVYRPIRHAVYGHRLKSNDEAGVALFPQTSREEVGKILDFLHDLTSAINELYLNGTKPSLGRDFEDHNERIRDEARAVMRKIAEAQV